MRTDPQDMRTGPEGRLPWLVEAPALHRLGLGALAALATLAVLLRTLPRIVAIDAAVWQAILYWRGCRWDVLVDGSVEIATRVTIGLLTAATALSLRAAGVRATWPPLAVCAVGLLAGKVLKNCFARERPSMIPDIALGHSFPSGHVMNTALAALALVILAAHLRHRHRWWAAGGVLLAIVGAGRVLLARHWLLDAVAGLLAALALFGLALPPFERRPLLAPALLASALALVLAADIHARALEIRLPSPLSARGPETTEVAIGAHIGTPVLQGAWEKTDEVFRGGALAWLRGSGTITITLPESGAGSVGRAATAGGAGAVLALAGRPDVRERRCLLLRVSVNGRALRPFVPFVGWREYRLRVPAGTLRPGPNEVRVEIADREGTPWRFALAYLRINPG